jgi:hypothetical protein
MFMKLVGTVLVIAGIVGLGWGVLHGGMSFSRQDRVIESGEAQGALVKTHTLPLAPIAGGFCILAGVVIIIAASKASADES